MRNYSRVCASVNLDAIEHNLKQLKQNLSEQTKIMAIIKADGYGHGSVPIAIHTEKLDFVWGFGVATVEEAILLRRAGITKPVFILGYTFEEDYPRIIEHNIRPTVFKVSMAKRLSYEAEAHGKKVKIHLALDTGMSRIGFNDQLQSADEIEKIMKLPGIEAEGIFTHFAKADEKDKAYTDWQLDRYHTFLNNLEKKNIHIPYKHTSNSAGIIEKKGSTLELVRAGISLYGLYPSDQVQKNTVKLQPAMSLRSHIVHLKEVEPGTRVSYGGTYTAVSKTKVATIPIGYADGYPRSLSNKGYVLVRGQKAPVIGRVCMDQFMVDVTGIPDVNDQDEVVLIGKQGEAEIKVEDLSALSGRFNYEFVCDIGKRVPRVYLKNGKATEAVDILS